MRLTSLLCLWYSANGLSAVPGKTLCKHGNMQSNGLNRATYELKI